MSDHKQTATPQPRTFAPERVFLKACHPDSPNEQCGWSVAKDREGSVEYIRADSYEAMREALKVALPRLAHRAACASVRPSSEWIGKGSVSFDGCQCEIRTVAAALALVEGTETK